MDETDADVMLEQQRSQLSVTPSKSSKSKSSSSANGSSSSRKARTPKASKKAQKETVDEDYAPVVEIPPPPEPPMFPSEVLPADRGDDDDDGDSTNITDIINSNINNVSKEKPPKKSVTIDERPTSSFSSSPSRQLGSTKRVTSQYMNDLGSQKFSDMFERRLDAYTDVPSSGVKDVNDPVKAYMIFQATSCQAYGDEQEEIRRRSPSPPSLSIKKVSSRYGGSKLGGQKKEFTIHWPTMIALAPDRMGVIRKCGERGQNLAMTTMSRIRLENSTTFTYFRSVSITHSADPVRERSLREAYHSRDKEATCIVVWKNILSEADLNFICKKNCNLGAVNQLPQSKDDSLYVASIANSSSESGPKYHLFTVGTEDNAAHQRQLEEWIRYFMKDHAALWLEKWQVKKHEQQCVFVDINDFKNDPTLDCEIYSI